MRSVADMLRHLQGVAQRVEQFIAIIKIIDSSKRQQSSADSQERKSGPKLVAKHPEEHQENESSNRARWLSPWITSFQWG